MSSVRLCFLCISIAAASQSIDYYAQHPGIAIDFVTNTTPKPITTTTTVSSTSEEDYLIEEGSGPGILKTECYTVVGVLGRKVRRCRRTSVSGGDFRQLLAHAARLLDALNAAAKSHHHHRHHRRPPM